MRKWKQQNDQWKEKNSIRLMWNFFTNTLKMDENHLNTITLRNVVVVCFALLCHTGMCFAPITIQHSTFLFFLFGFGIRTGHEMDFYSCLFFFFSSALLVNCEWLYSFRNIHREHGSNEPEIEFKIIWI